MAEFDFADEMDPARTNVYLAGPLSLTSTTRSTSISTSRT